jgi:hypothetical protein
MERGIFLMVLILQFAATSFAQQSVDGTVKRNGKWDPNDPACPCYKIQKQAEKEYQEMLQNETGKQQKDMSKTLRAEIRLQKKETRKKEAERMRIRKRKKDGKAVCPPI